MENILKEILDKLSSMDSKIDNLEKGQKEIKESLSGFGNEYSTTMQNLSNKVDVIDNKIDKLSADIIAVEAITGKNMADIAHLKLIK